MICALLDFETTTPNNGVDAPFIGIPTFRCKMPQLPSDRPDIMGFELLNAHIIQHRSWAQWGGSMLYLMDNAMNYHNNTLQNEIALTHLEIRDWNYYNNVYEPDNPLVYTNRGVNKYQMDMGKSHKVYISTHQDYLYFNIQDKFNRDSSGTHTNGYWNAVDNRVKMIVRLTFDKKDTQYQPKRIML
jgi:hypothetical protein